MILYSVLGVFTILAILSAGYGERLLPSAITNLIVAKKQDSSTTSSSGGILATDFFL